MPMHPQIAPTWFSVAGTLSPLAPDFFDNDAPILDKGDADIMCWKSKLTDNTGSIVVKVWDKPCYDIFGVTADKLREMWESGVENPGERDAILASLITNLAHNVDTACSAEMWRWGAREEKVAVNVNINDIELESGTS